MLRPLHSLQSNVQSKRRISSRNAPRWHPPICENISLTRYIIGSEFQPSALQRSVEALSGRRLHKQNFRRLVETSAIVEATGDMALKTGGRPVGALSLPPQCAAGTLGAGIAGRHQGVRRDILVVTLRLPIASSSQFVLSSFRVCRRRDPYLLTRLSHPEA